MLWPEAVKSEGPGWLRPPAGRSGEASLRLDAAPAPVKLGTSFSLPLVGRVRVGVGRTDLVRRDPRPGPPHKEEGTDQQNAATRAALANLEARPAWRCDFFKAMATAAVLAISSAPDALAQRCVTPADLAARAGEEHPVKGVHTFDASEKPIALAPFTPVPPSLRGVIRRVELPPGKKLIALTFDLCEQPGEIAGYDGAIFDYLRREGIKATLFTGGKWMRSHAERFPQLLTDPLFEIANHASAHRNLRLLSSPALEAEISGPQRAYEALRATTAATQCFAKAAARTPPRLALFRFPYGACNDAALAAVNDAGLLAIQWDVSTGDPSPGTSAQEIANAMVHGVRPGSIVINHANGRGFHTAAGLPLAIPKLKAAGYQFVTVSELLAAGKPVIAPTCYNVKPGDTDRYDHPLGLLAGHPGAGKTRAASAQSTEVLPWLTQTVPSTPKPAREPHVPAQKSPGWWPF